MISNFTHHSAKKKFNGYPWLMLPILFIQDILINNDFLECFQKLKEQLPDIKMRHGGDGVPKKPKARVHPMVKLKNYIDRNNLRLVDFFNKFDTDNSMSVTREEFAQGIEVCKIWPGLALRKA